MQQQSLVIFHLLMVIIVGERAALIIRRAWGTQCSPDRGGTRGDCPRHDVDTSLACACQNPMTLLRKCNSSRSFPILSCPPYYVNGSPGMDLPGQSASGDTPKNPPPKSFKYDDLVHHQWNRMVVCSNIVTVPLQELVIANWNIPLVLGQLRTP